jgi:hypothetical protein
MKSIIMAAAIACCPWLAFAQFFVQGQVSDGVEFLPGVNVTLFRDSAVVSLAQTDSLGQYRLADVSSGSYRLSCSFMGYDPFVTVLVVKGDEPGIHVSEILMHEATLELSAVEITADRLAVEQLIDRMVIRPGESVTAAGNNVVEVLQKSPGVMVNRQTGVISINGRAGVRVMINNKAMQLSGDVVLQMLEGVNAAQVERIEIIASPPASYDAEGAGGIIQIFMREDSTHGTSGSLALTLGARWAPMGGLTFNVTHRTKKSAWFLDYSGTVNHNKHIMTMRRELIVAEKPITMMDHSPRENVTTQQNLNVGAEWRIGKNTELDMSFAGFRRDWELDAVASNTTVFNTDSVRETAMHATESNVWQSAMGSLALQQRLNASHRIDVTLDYLFYHNNNPSQYHGNIPEADEIALTKKTPIHVVVATTQYTHTDPNAVFSWDAGLKAVFSVLDNGVSVQRRYNGDWQTDALLTTWATQRERILAAYISTVWRPGANWDISTGLRYEHTRTDIEMSADPRSVQRRYGYWFPQLSIRKQLASGSEYFLGYSRRITRPTYNDIAPYVFFWGPDSFSSGNTTLWPALSSQVTTGLRYQEWTCTLAYSHTGNSIAMMQPEILSGSTLVFRSQNLEALNTLSITTSYATQVYSWWDFRGDVTLQRQSGTTAHLPVNFQRQMWGVNLNAGTVLKLPAKVAFEVSGMYQSRSLSGASEFLPYGSLNAGISRQLGAKGVLKLAVDDILYTNMWRIRTLSPENNLDVDFNYDWHNRFVRLTYTWTPGNDKVRPNRTKYGSEEERQRVNP